LAGRKLVTSVETLALLIEIPNPTSQLCNDASTASATVSTPGRPTVDPNTATCGGVMFVNRSVFW